MIYHRLWLQPPRLHRTNTRHPSLYRYRFVDCFPLNAQSTKTLTTNERVQNERAKHHHTTRKTASQSANTIQHTINTAKAPIKCIALDPSHDRFLNAAKIISLWLLFSSQKKKFVIRSMYYKILLFFSIAHVIIVEELV